jgi:protein-disulfide isomerase
MRKCFLFLVLFLSGSALAAHAQDFSYDVEWTVIDELNLQSPVLDVAAPTDVNSLYILTSGNILLYSLDDATLIKQIPIEKIYNRLTASADGSYVVVSSTTKRNLKIISLENSYNFSTEALPFIGPKEADVTITVFNDYQCPYCKNLTTLFEQVMEKYPGKINLVYKNFPLAMHNSARLGAAAALAADRQQKFPQFHKSLYENQRALSEAKINEVAQELGLDSEKFKNDLKDPAIQDIIARDVKEGQLAGVRGTPTVFINGKRVEERSLEEFSRKIDLELRKNAQQ